MRTGDLLICGFLCWVIADVGGFGYHTNAEGFHAGWTAIGTAFIFAACWLELSRLGKQ